MIVRWLVIAPLVLSAGLGGIAFSQARVDAAGYRDFDEELLYLPNEQLLTHFTGGMSSVIADLLWLRCIEYTAHEWRGDFKFTWLEQMCRTITTLDPYFHDVYSWGGMALAMLKQDDNASIDLLKDGIRHHPTSWEMPFEIGRTYILNRGDEQQGAIYLAMAVATGNAPGYVVNWTEDLHGIHGLNDVERSMWQDVLDNNDEEHMRELASRKLQELNLREVANVLTDVSRKYTTKYGNPPTSLDDLERAGFIEGQPADPLGGTYVFDDEGVAFSTSVLDSIKDERLVPLRGWIDEYKEKFGGWPADLNDIVGRTHATGLTAHPYPNGVWEYDPETGEVK
jgi:hypothetical protein